MWRTLVQEDALRSPLGHRSLAPADTRFSWISRPDGAEVRQQTCWQRLSSLAIKPSSRTYLSTAASRGPTLFFIGFDPVPVGKGIHTIEVKGSPLDDMLSDDAMATLAAESESALAEFVVPSGEIIMPMDAHIVTAKKGWMPGYLMSEFGYGPPVEVNEGRSAMRSRTGRFEAGAGRLGRRRVAACGGY